GAALGEYIAQQMYPGVPKDKLTEEQKQTISALGTLAAGLVGGIAGDSTADAVAGAQAGKTSLENNTLNLGKGFSDYGQAQTSLGTTLIQSGASSEDVAAALDKATKGDLPDGVNITKVIVDGYVDGALITGAWYIGPAATAGKVVSGAIIAEIANGTYQWFDLSQPGNENKSWDYKGSISAGVTGALAPGRGIWTNLAITQGGAIFTDGLDKGSLTGSGAGWLFGTTVGLIAPPVFDPVLGAGSAPVGDIIGAIGGEFISNAVKDGINEKEK
ncbi:VENN motif pre-toxin domain-containing protein, partial [Tenebrionicola larvae]